MTPQIISTIGVPIVVGLVEALKRAGVPSQYSAVFAVLFGILIALAANYPFAGVPVLLALLQGVCYGLAAAGLYSGTQAVAGGYYSARKTRTQNSGDITRV